MTRKKMFFVYKLNRCTMAFRSKLRVDVKEATTASIDSIFEKLQENYDITYCGLHEVDNGICIFIQNKNKMSPNVVAKLLVETVPILSIEPYTEVSGNVITKIGEIKKRGGVCGKRKSYKKRITKSSDQGASNITNNNNNTTNNNITNNIDNSTNNNNNINFIFVNPIGQESLDHITPEFIQQLLSEHHGPEVVFEFGTKMYSLQENMNFKSDIKSGYISGRTDMDGAWETRRKNDGFKLLMDNLKDKNEEAVLKYLEDIPDDDLEKFKQDMGWIREHKISRLQEHAPVYNKFVRDGFNLLTANIADRIRRIERDCGKRVKLV